MLKIVRLVIALGFVSLLSCSKNDDPANGNNGSISGQWVIHYYWDEKNETSDFAGYVFEFLGNGQLKAKKGSTTVTGSWQETSSKFIINFGNDPVLEEINDDWEKIERTSTLIHLEDDNPGQDDELHFVRL
ncbi:hypothetical protein [Pollutibacter soli]|uniref:hypothetical protein n=1 Tax=Pollutibacter soli TaxID=3034157 RepID=UPI0030134ED0